MYPHLVPIYNLLGLTHATNNEKLQCLEKFKRCLILNPLGSDVLNNLSSILVDFGCFNQATVHGKKSIVLRPDGAEGYNNLGRGLGSLDCREKALEYLEFAIKIDKTKPEIFLNLATNLRAVGKYRRAVQLLEKCLIIDKSYVEAHEELGKLLSILGEERAAEDKFLIALKLDPLRVSTRVFLCSVFEKQCRHDEALSQVEVCSGDDQNSKNARLLEASIQFELGDYRKSIELYKQRILEEPFDSMIYNEIATIEDKVGHYSSSRRNCYRALVLKPNNILALAGMVNTDRKIFKERNIAKWLSFLVPRRPTADKSKLDKNFEITALFCFGRSGSLFFQSLFDGHPQIATIPGVYLKSWFTDGSGSF